MLLSAVLRPCAAAAPLLLGPRRPPLSIDISCMPARQSAANPCTPLLRSNNVTDGRTDTRPFHRHCPAYYADSVDNVNNHHITWRKRSPISSLILKQHTQPFNGLFSRTTWVSRYQKGKTNLDFTGARDSEWQWHQLGHMHVCTSLQTDNHASTPPLVFLQDGCPSCRPTNSIKALKACRSYNYYYLSGTTQMFFTGRMPFLPPNQQRQSTEGNNTVH